MTRKRHGNAFIDPAATVAGWAAADALKQRHRGELYHRQPLKFLSEILGHQVVDVVPRTLPEVGHVWAARLIGGETVAIAGRYHDIHPDMVNAALAGMAATPPRPLGRVGARHVRCACVTFAWRKQHAAAVVPPPA